MLFEPYCVIGPVNYLVTKPLPGLLSNGQTKMKRLLGWKENLLILDYQTGLFPCLLKGDCVCYVLN